MKKRILLISLALLAVVSTVLAEQVILTFHADGVELDTIHVEEGSTYTIAALLSRKEIDTPIGCRGYNFVGWKTDGPVEEGVTPSYKQSSESITPEANMNLYAVYQKDSGDTDRFTRITSTSDLRPGQYIIVCYYDWDGDTYYGPSYYALGNTQDVIPNIVYGTGDTYEYTYQTRPPRTTTVDVYAEKHTISATQVFPNAGTISTADNTIIWTLSGSEGAWKWTNQNASKSLYLRAGYGDAYFKYNDQWYILSSYNYNQYLLDNDGANCSITAANGAFNFQTGAYYLTYSEDEEDYFKTGTSNDWTFYLYKKESEFTSFPNCSLWTVHLDALDGTIIGTDPDTSKTDVAESSSGSGVVALPSATMSGSACSTWDFAGWNPEAPIYGTTQAPSLQIGTYNPSYDGTTLYAVYQQGENATYWEKVTSVDEIVTGGVYVMVYTGNNRALTYNNSNTSWTGTPVTAPADRITSNVEASMEWTFNGDYFYNVTDDGSHRLAYNGSTSQLYQVVDAGSYMYKLQNKGYTNYYIRWNTNFAESRTNSQNTFYIFKKVTTYATYSSYPHCTPYNVTLNVAGGKFEDTGSRENRTIQEVTAGSGVPLPEVLPLCPDDGWKFVGWQEGSEVGSVKEVTYTGLHTTSYAPSRDGVTLYAVFRRNINKFQILYQPTEMVAGDNYVITGYDGTYDWEISSNTYSANYLLGVKAAAPMGEEGYFIEVDTTAAGWKNVLWTMAGTYDNCTFLNVGNSKYLASDNTNPNGRTMTANAGTAYRFARPNASFYFTMQDRTTSKYMRYNGTNHYFYTNNSQNERFYVYRQMKEYTSWPHCDPFTVKFDACDGSVTGVEAGGAGELPHLTESKAYAGIVLPNAYANSDCAKEGWSFVGWAASPVSEESNILPLDVMPAGTVYNPAVNNGTLYAVYQQKTNTYKRITALSDLRLGLNYIIATSANYAMSNKAQSTNFVASKSVTPTSNIITSDDADIEWRVQGVRGAFELFNLDDSVYLDLSTAGYALLKDTIEDNFVIIVQSGVFYVRSIQALSNTKYLGFTSTYFNTVDDEHLSTIYFYQQQGLYHSYPNCAEGVEALRWDKEGGNSYVYVESYVLLGSPNMDGAVGDAVLQEDEGTYKFKYNTSVATAGSQKAITWNGTTSRLSIPFVVASSANIDAIGLPDKSETCDVVILDGATLTVNADKSIHNLTIYEGATLNVSDGYTLTVNSLILRCEDDQNMPTINLNSTGAISLNNDEFYFDARIDEERYYWFSLPFDAQLQEISYSNLEANGGAPIYRTDFWVKYYDGARRVDDINNSSYTGNATGSKYWSHVADKGDDYTLKAGQGYIVGINDQKNTKYNDQNYTHSKRVMRFTLKTESGWLANERVGGTKTTTVVPSVTNDPRNIAHAGWNLIGNPYMHAYTAGSSSSGVGGLRVGAWEKDDDGWYVLDEDSLLNVPYLTKYIYDETESKWKYVQRLASNTTLHPFEAVFVQINEGNAINFANLSHYIPNNAPAYMRNAAYEEETPFRTGVVLSGAGKTDATGIVLAAEYSPAYEIGADLMKMLNSKALNLYTLNADNQELAFNGLSEENAMDPIPVGVIFPSAGTYTFAFDANQYSMDGLESLVLIDKVAGTQTELLHFEYDFTIDGAATINNRFELLVRRAHKVPTDISFTSEEDQEVSARKFIREGKLFIIRDNKIYDATGARVQ